MATVDIRRVLVPVVGLLVLLAAPESAKAQEEPPPPTGTAQIVVGWIGTGVGAFNFATVPVCYADFYPEQSKDLCVELSIGIGAVGLGVGIPMLIVGYSRRAEYKRWKADHPALNELTKLRVSAVQGGGVLGYRTEF
jgi:hypothetical protein